MSDSKKTAQIIIALTKGKPTPAEENAKPKSIAELLSGMGKHDEESEDDDMTKDGLQDAIKSFWEAGESKDWATAAEALSDMMSLCSSDESDETPYLDKPSMPMLDDDK